MPSVQLSCWGLQRILPENLVWAQQNHFHRTKKISSSEPPKHCSWSHNLRAALRWPAKFTHFGPPSPNKNRQRTFFFDWKPGRLGRLGQLLRYEKKRWMTSLAPRSCKKFRKNSVDKSAVFTMWTFCKPSICRKMFGFCGPNFSAHPHPWGAPVEGLSAVAQMLEFWLDADVNGQLPNLLGWLPQFWNKSW